MNFRNRKLRLAILLAIAAFAAFYAWRTSMTKDEPRDCVAGRAEVKDASGKVTEIKRTTCM
ncbi:MAG: hypothetical protein EOP58_12745 [Sphingomonadales bacterium]|nr:MAG: hypothetical protein EOP58_12745 [Sphingomonadales bacterium]